MFNKLVNPSNHPRQKSRNHLYVLEFQIQFQGKEIQWELARLKNNLLNHLI